MDPKLAARLTERLARLTEAGRVLSGANEKAIRAAIEALQAVLAKVADGEAAESAQIVAVDTALCEAEAILAQDDSYEGRRMRVQKALTDRHRAMRAAAFAAGVYDPEYGCYPWIRDLYDDAVIFEQDSQLYRSEYAIDADGAVTLGDGVRVQVSYVPVEQPAEPTEAHQVEVVGPLVELMERAIRPDGTVPIKIIQPGWGSSGYYGAEMLERDGPTVFTKGLHMYLDHPTATEEAERPEGSVKNIGAVLASDARWDPKHKAGPGLYADAKVMPAFAEHLDALAPHIGTSIRSLGTVEQGEAEGKAGPIITSLVAAKSVDFVTHAGAGGAVLSLLESARARRAPAPPTGGQTVDPKEAQALKESNATLTTQLGETRTELQETRAQLARVQAAQVLREARDVVASTLATIPMPDIVRNTLAERLAANPPVTEDKALDTPKLVEAVKAEAAREIEYLQKAGLGTGAVRGMGSGGAPAELDEAKADELLESAFTDFLGSGSAGKIAAASR